MFSKADRKELIHFNLPKFQAKFEDDVISFIVYLNLKIWAVILASVHWVHQSISIHFPFAALVALDVYQISIHSSGTGYVKMTK